MVRHSGRPIGTISKLKGATAHLDSLQMAPLFYCPCIGTGSISPGDNKKINVNRLRNIKIPKVKDNNFENTHTRVKV